MQNELNAAGLPVSVQILGINGIGQDDGNQEMVAGRDLPWLQDIESQDVWASWQVVFRDVVLLDGENFRFYVFNLTDNDLSDEEHYATLKNALQDLATE